VEEQELEKVLEQHQLWLKSDGKEGAKADLRRISLNGEDLDEVDLRGADLSSADLSEANILYADFSGANLSGANLSGADLSGANFSGVDLSYANLQATNFRETDLENANLANANLSEAVLSFADLRGANFENTNLLFANMYDSFFGDTILHGISIFDKDLMNIPESLRDMYRNTFKIFNAKQHNPHAIKREIEFPPEYHQAGAQILNYFSSVLNKKYPKKQVKVKIEQKGQKVTMIVETQEGDKEIIERELHEYGMVVTGGMTPEEFYPEDRLAVIELKAQLHSANGLLETQKLIIEEKNRALADKNRDIDRQHDLILGFQRIILTATKNPPRIENTQPITINNTTKVSQSTVIELTRKDKSQITELVDAIKRSLDEFKVSQDNEKKVVELIESIKKDLQKDKPDFFGVRDNLNSINNLLQGAAGSLIASGLLGQVPGIISRIFG
jgi:hypothetical protein